MLIVVSVKSKIVIHAMLSHPYLLEYDKLYVKRYSNIVDARRFSYVINGPRKSMAGCRCLEIVDHGLDVGIQTHVTSTVGFIYPYAMSNYYHKSCVFDSR